MLARTDLTLDSVSKSGAQDWADFTAKVHKSCSWAALLTQMFGQTAD